MNLFFISIIIIIINIALFFYIGSVFWRYDDVLE